VWELVEKILKKDKQNDLIKHRGNYLWGLITDLYIESICNRGNITVLKGWRCLPQDIQSVNFKKDIYNISTLEIVFNLLSISHYFEILAIESLEEFKDTPEFIIFKEFYFRLILKSRNLNDFKYKLSTIITNKEKNFAILEDMKKN